MEQKNEVMTQNNKNGLDVLEDIKNTNQMCSELMKTPHYAKIGSAGIFAIVQKARTLNVDPMDALNGGLYSVNGKVEMSAQMMTQLIRQSGHSLTKDSRSNDVVCILHGKRKDNGDTWVESFSIEDAQRAGIYKQNSPWSKFPRNMLYARALSNLARQLFADVIKGCYVEGEISRAVALDAVIETPQPQTIEAENISVADAPKLPIISEDQYGELNDLIGEDDEYRSKIEGFIKYKFKGESLRDLPEMLYVTTRGKIIEHNYKKENTMSEEEAELNFDQAVQ